jgi:hypothetical protein
VVYYTEVPDYTMATHYCTTVVLHTTVLDYTIVSIETIVHYTVVVLQTIVHYCTVATMHCYTTIVV